MKLLLMVLFLIYLSINVGACSSEEGPAPSFSNSVGTSNLDSDRTSGIPNRISINANFPDDYGDISVKKSASPNYKDFYLLNKTYYVKVEITGIGRSVDNITIREKLDPNLRITIAPPYPNIADPFDDTSIEYLKKVNSSKLSDKTECSYSVDYKNNSIYLKIKRLKPKQCIKYNFNITSNKTGVYSSATLVRIAGDASKLSDLYIPFDIEVRPPVFEVHIEKGTTQVIAGDPLNVTYNILHKSGWCIDPFQLDVTFKNSRDNEYIIYRDGKIYNGEKINTLFSTLTDSPVNIMVVYKHSGIQSLPSILIENEVVPIAFEESQIKVYEKWINKYMEEYEPTYSTYGLILALLLSLISIIMSINDIMIGRKEINIMNNQVSIMSEELAIMKKEFDNRNHKYVRNTINTTAYTDFENVPLSKSIPKP